MVPLFVAVAILCLSGCHGTGMTVQMSNINDWGGRFEGHFQFPVQGEDLQGWEAVLTFSAPVTGLTVSLLLKVCIEQNISIGRLLHIELGFFVFSLTLYNLDRKVRGKLTLYLGIEFYLFVSRGGMKRQRVHV